MMSLEGFEEMAEKFQAGRQKIALKDYLSLQVRQLFYRSTVIARNLSAVEK